MVCFGGLLSNFDILLQAYVIYYSLLNFFIPFIILLFCYSKMCAVLWGNFKQKKEQEKAQFATPEVTAGVTRQHSGISPSAAAANNSSKLQGICQTSLRWAVQLSMQEWLRRAASRTGSSIARMVSLARERSPPNSLPATSTASAIFCPII